MTKIHLQYGYGVEYDKDTQEHLLKTLIAERYGLPINAIQLELLDFFKVVSEGAKKYKMNDWLAADGKRSCEKDMHDSMFHHLAESFTGGQHYKGTDSPRFIWDKESGLDPLLHLQCRAGMLYTRRKRNIVHDDDQ